MHFPSTTLVGITVPVKSASNGLSFVTSLTLTVMSKPFMTSVLLTTIGTLSKVSGVVRGALKIVAVGRQYRSTGRAGQAIPGDAASPRGREDWHHARTACTVNVEASLPR